MQRQRHQYRMAQRTAIRGFSIASSLRTPERIPKHAIGKKVSR